MPKLEQKEILDVISRFPVETKFTNFVESGTFLGETILSMEPLFEKLYTVELAPHLVTRMKNLYNGNKISFILGNSGEIFKNLLPNITDPTVFWLDGHYSNNPLCAWSKNPLLEETGNIIDKLQNFAIIIIDDVRLFGDVADSWEHISEEKIFKIVKSRTMGHYFFPSSVCEKDRMVIFLNKK